MTNIVDKEVAFLRRLRLRFDDHASYAAVITDMKKEGIISAAAANAVLKQKRNVPTSANNRKKSSALVSAEALAKLMSTTETKKGTRGNRSSIPPAYSGCEGNRSRC